MARSKSILLLPPATGDIPEQGIIVCQCAQPWQKNIEHAGRGYQELLEQRLKQHHGDDDAMGYDDQNDDDDFDNDDDDGNDSEHIAWKLKKLSAKNSEDYYELLELGNLRWRATEDDIKKAFRTQSLKYHPDKVSSLGQEALDHADEHFKKIRTAYDLLSDKKKRAAYDSVDDVDDSIPTEKDISSVNFFQKLGPVFDYNARWSTASRVPKLGTQDASAKEIDKFYDFWYSFKTWRDFSNDLEFDPDQAESREERRWMERQNAKVLKQRKLEEASRIRALVDLAFKLDPRIIQRKEEEKQKKEQLKQEKIKKREEEERIRKEEQEKLEREKVAKEQAEKEKREQEKREKDKQKKALRKAKQRLRASVEPLQKPHLNEQVESLCNDLKEAEFTESLTERLSALVAEGNMEAVKQLLESTRQEIEDQLSAELQKREKEMETIEQNLPTPQSNKPVTSRPWTVDEITALTKAFVKFPGGTRNRWERIAEHLGNRTAAEVLLKSVELRSGNASAIPAVDDFTRYKQKTKGAGRDVDNTDDDTVAVSSTVISTSSKDSGAGTDKPTVVSANASADSGPPNELNFTKKQQASLEEAMKKFPPSLGEGRWEKIAAAVPGRTSIECEARFKELVAYFKAKKAGKK